MRNAVERAWQTGGKRCLLQMSLLNLLLPFCPTNELVSYLTSAA